MNAELLPKAIELIELAKKDQFVNQLVMRCLSERKMTSLGQMAHEHPEVFEDLYDCCKTMVEELPWV